MLILEERAAVKQEKASISGQQKEDQIENDYQGRLGGFPTKTVKTPKTSSAPAFMAMAPKFGRNIS